MIPAVQRFKAWLARRRKSRLLWRNLHLTGASDCHTVVLCYAGLAANGAVSQKKVARELYRRFDRRVEFWQRNLWGHTGLYGHFRESRMWNWIWDGWSALRKLIRRPGSGDVFIFGHSTGGLVGVLLAWAFERFPRLFGKEAMEARLCGVVLNAPAFVLRSRRNTALLTVVLLLYYVICPAVFIAIPFVKHGLWDLTLAVAVFFFLLLPRVRVPTASPEAQAGPKPSLRERLTWRAEQYRALSLVIHFGIAPVVILLAALWLPIGWIRAALWLFLGSIIAALMYLPRGRALEAYWEEDEEEEVISDRYKWLPVITAATLLPLQWAARRAVVRLKCPVLFILGEKDRVVDNKAAEAIFSRLRTKDAELVVAEGIYHSNTSEVRQLQLVDIMEEWLSGRHFEEGRPPERGQPPLQVKAEGRSAALLNRHA